MKINTIQSVCATLFFVAVSSAVEAVDVAWTVNDADPDNILTNEVHFTPATADIPHSDALLVTAESDMTVRMPAGSDCMVPYGLKFFVKGNKYLTLDFSGARLTQPDTTSDFPYTQDERFGLGRWSGTSVSHWLRYAWPARNTNGAFRIEDGLLSVTNRADNFGGIDILRGTWDFLAPNSTTNAGGYLYIASGWIRNFRMNLHPGSELRAPIFFIYGSSATNEINVLGGSHYMAEMHMRILTSGKMHDTYPRTRLNVVGEGSRLAFGSFTAVSGSSGYYHGYRVYVADGGTLVGRGNIYQKPNAGYNFVFDHGIFSTDNRNISWQGVSAYATNSQFNVAQMIMSSGYMELKDSVWTGTSLYLGDSPDNPVALKIDGGTFTVSGIVDFGTSANPNSKGTLEIVGGGVLKSAAVVGNSAAVLLGNGGTLRASAPTQNFIGNLGAAKCGAAGLTVESDYDITIPQSFIDADGAKGELILAGAGTKTLTGAATTVSKIVVSGGTVVFAAGARVASEVSVINGAKVVFAESPATVGVTGFVCGDGESAGAVAVASASTLDFGSAPIKLNKVNLVLDGEVAAGSSYELMRTTGEVSDASKAAWANSLGSVGFSELSYSFAVSLSDEIVSLGMEVSGAAETFSATAGSSLTVSDDVSVGRMETIVADVESGATLAFAGSLAEGSLMKSGAGRLSLENEDNIFLRGIISSGGVLSAASVGALGFSPESSHWLKLTGGIFEYLGDGTPAAIPGVLSIAAPVANDAVGLKIESPLTVSNITVSGGAIIKRGAAALTLAPPPGTVTRLAPSTGQNTGGDPISPYSIGDLSDNTGALPTSGYLGFNVAEGEVRLVGDSSTTFKFATAMIGVSATNGRAQPSLVIDGAKVDCTEMMHVHLSGFTQADAFNVAPRLLITNGAEVVMHDFLCGRNAARINYPTVTVDRATWTFNSSFRAGYNDTTRPTYFLDNGAVVNAARFLCYGPSYFFVTNSIVRKNAAGDCTSAEFHYAGGTWMFGKGSTLALSSIKTTSSGECTGFTLAFDGGTWLTGGSADIFHLYKAEKFTFRTLGAGGLTLPVAEGNTLPVGRAISGDGGLVKTGAGTLAFETQGTWNEQLTEKTLLDDQVTLAFDGLLDVREGAVTVANGACREGGAYRTAQGASIDFGGNALAGTPTFSGSGTFANASAGDVTLFTSLTGDAPATFSDITFGGRIRVAFNEEVSDEVEAVTVATFTGAIPDISRFYSKGLGNMFMASFSFDGNAVKAKIFRGGLFMIVR